MPEFGIGFGNDAGNGRKARRPRPSLPLRLLEASGLLLVMYGLGSYRVVPVAAGAVMILGSYALYRRKHGRFPLDGPDGFGDGPDGDGGGD